ncbi:MAG TPA: hypothetical protein VFE62_12625 [Gemmataceae bacterium]|nr:hypothetical protein [Gemmataceae bacterium]
MQRLFLATVILAFALVAPLGAGDKKKTEPGKKDAPVDFVIDGEISNIDLKDDTIQSYCKTYTFKMEKDKTYHISMTGNGIAPYVRLLNSANTQIAAANGQPAAVLHKATKTEEMTIIACSQGNGVGKFTLTIRDATRSTISTINDKLNQNDGVYQGRRHKVFEVALEAGKTYQIDMRSGAFDSYLFLESPGKKLLAQDDDGGGYPSARIVHKATETGKHRVIASHFGNGGALGDFQITVMITQGTPPAQKNVDGAKKE